MTMYRHAGLAVMFCLEGLVPQEVQAQFCEWYLWSTAVRYDEHNHAGIVALQSQGLELLEQGKRILPDVYDRPKGHRLLEIIRKTLPLLGRLRLAATGNFEKHHQMGKGVNPN